MWAAGNVRLDDPTVNTEEWLNSVYLYSAQSEKLLGHFTEITI
jgi:hypothetical protein